MLTNVYCKGIEQLYTTPIVQQTSFWSAVKESLGEKTLAINFRTTQSCISHKVNEDKSVLSDLLVIVKRIDSNHSVAYVPYGPELEPEDDFQGLFLEELSESMRSFLPADCIAIRYDLRWESYWAKDREAYDESGIWKGEPHISTQELRFNFNTINWNFRKSSSNILPSHTIFLDLKRDINAVLQGMKPKTRYNIHVAARKGVSVRTIGIHDIDIWYKLYVETAHRNNIYLNDIKYFKAVLNAQMYQSKSPAEVMLLVAEWNDMPLASMFLVIAEKRASYLYGASSSAHRNLMATYALQWEAINLAKQKGCTEYDMFGVSPTPNPTHPLYGLYKFKVGFGGDLYHSLGCWDYPLMNDKYNCFIAKDLSRQGFHLS